MFKTIPKVMLLEGIQQLLLLLQQQEQWRGSNAAPDSLSSFAIKMDASCGPDLYRYLGEHH